MGAATCINFDKPIGLSALLTELMVSRDMFDETLERTGRLRFNPG